MIELHANGCLGTVTAREVLKSQETIIRGDTDGG